MHIEIKPYEPEYEEAVIDLTIDAWSPVFARTKLEVPRFVYDAFYPDGWELRQKADVLAILSVEPQNIWLAHLERCVAGFVGVRTHSEDQMGEISIIAVRPAYQRQGVGRQLMRFAEDRMRSAGLKMVMVETVGDSGHEPARRAYSALGYETWPVARYFKPL